MPFSSFIEIKSTHHTAHSCAMYHSVVLTIFTRLCNPTITFRTFSSSRQEAPWSQNSITISSFFSFFEAKDCNLIIFTSQCLVQGFFHSASAKSIQSRPTLCDPMDCSLPGSSVHGILQARILEWVAMPFSRVFHSRCSINVCQKRTDELAGFACSTPKFTY